MVNDEKYFYALQNCPIIQKNCYVSAGYLEIRSIEYPTSYIKGMTVACDHSHECPPKYTESGLEVLPECPIWQAAPVKR